MLRPFSTNVDIDISPPTRSPRVHGTTRTRIVRWFYTGNHSIIVRPPEKYGRPVSDYNVRKTLFPTRITHPSGRNVLIADGLFRCFFNERTKNRLRRTRHVGSSRYTVVFYPATSPIFDVTATDCLWSNDVQRRPKRRHAVPRRNDRPFLCGCHTTRNSLSPNRRRFRTRSGDGVRVRTAVFHLYTRIRMADTRFIIITRKKQNANIRPQRAPRDPSAPFQRFSKLHV